MEWFVDTARRLGDADRAGIREDAQVPGGAHVVLVAAKHAQLGPWFKALVTAAGGRTDVAILVKPHPAEGDAPYLADAEGASHVHVAPAGADLARLTAIARVLVTANSTAAIEAMALDVPALVVGLPTNLTPFVDAGAMMGAATLHELAPALNAVIDDETVRARLAECRRAFVDRYGMVPPPGASGRAAGVVAAFTRV
jgi:hypothetical protein